MSTRAFQTVPAGSLVLVTGVTGYIGSHAAQQLLEQGYRVRGTVRDVDSSKSRHLKKLFEPFGDSFEVVQAGDLEEPNVFDEAVKDVDGILHIASPFHHNVEDAYRDMINPAVNGSLSILRSAQKYGDKVKRVVVTSSGIAVYGPPKGENYVYSEKDWNDKMLEDVERRKDDKEFIKIYAYRASKVAAERAVWRFNEEEKPHFGISVINPAIVFGPVIHEVEDIRSITVSVGLLWKYFKDPDVVRAATPFQCFVDVRDTAAMHILALQKPEAAGKRFISSSKTFAWQEVVDILHEHYPTRKCATGGEGAGVYKVPYESDTSLSREILGIQYMTLEKSVIETIESLRQFW